jgi:REP element-mobilizing transposase RayT
MWNLPAPPGFQGLRADLPLTCYTRHMPHWRQDGATYVVTFRLGDSLPKSKLAELSQLKEEWERRPPSPDPLEEMEAFAKLVGRKTELWLDAGHGDCLLKQAKAAKSIAESMHHFDGDRYELGCYVVMPNHVHVVVRPVKPQEHPLETILKSWKSFSAVQINRIRDGSGAVWQEESYDRILRDGEHLWRTVKYIGRNPVLAGLAPGSCRRWIRPEWVKLGWGFDDEG